MKRYYRTTKIQSLLCKTQNTLESCWLSVRWFWFGVVLSLQKPRVCHFPPSQLILKVLNFLSISSIAILYLCQRMHECVKQAGTREDLCSCKWTELLREQGMGQADLLSIRCLLHTLPPLAQDAAAPLHPLTDAERWHKVRAVATTEISKDALSKIPVHLLNPKHQSCPDTFWKVCPGSALSFLKPLYKSTPTFEEDGQKYKEIRKNSFTRSVVKHLKRLP